jgi:hypothetical protein
MTETAFIVSSMTVMVTCSMLLVVAITMLRVRMYKRSLTHLRNALRAAVDENARLRKRLQKNGSDPTRNADWWKDRM